MKKVIIFLALLYSTFSLYAATLVGTPRIDFGTAVYGSGGKGLIIINVKTNPNSAINTVTTSGSGYIKDWQANYQVAPIQFTGMNKKTNKYLYFQLSSQTYTIQTPGCGEIYLENVGIDNYGNQYKRYNIKNENALTQAEDGIFLAAEMSLTSYTGNGTCTISGDIPFQYEETPGTASNWITANMEVSFTLQAPFSFTHDDDAFLNFGTLCRANQAQTLTITPAGTVGGPNVACPVSADISSDSFTVSSSGATSFSVALPNTITLSSGNNNLSVTDTTSSCSGGCSVGAGGSTSFGVGGTLTVPANAPVGNYTGTYSVTVTY